MKAVLVIDMPKSCADCELADFGRCWGTRSYIYMRFDDIPVACPLKPLPVKWTAQLNGLSSDQQIANWNFAEVWNKCLERIKK